MRIWSLHPQYLDGKGLVALWRETLLARKVLLGQTKGYTRHPQLTRFTSCRVPMDAMDYYLSVVYREAIRRHYSFDPQKFRQIPRPFRLCVHQGQLDYEFQHLLRKLQQRDPARYRLLGEKKVILPHPLFRVVEGEVEFWEKTIQGI